MREREREREREVVIHNSTHVIVSFNYYQLFRKRKIQKRRDQFKEGSTFVVVKVNLLLFWVIFKDCVSL